MIENRAQAEALLHQMAEEVGCTERVVAVLNQIVDKWVQRPLIATLLKTWIIPFLAESICEVVEGHLDWEQPPGVLFGAPAARCGCSDDMPSLSEGVAGGWPDSVKYDLRWTVDFDRAPLGNDLATHADYFNLFNTMMRVIEDTCDVRLPYVDGAESARIAIDFGTTGKGILGWSEIGGSSSGVYSQRYGSGWDWSFRWLGEVILHEMGHMLGLSHDVCSAGGEQVIMCPSIQTPYSLEYDSRTAAFLQSIYGRPIGGPDEPDDDLEIAGKILIRCGEFLGEYELCRLGDTVAEKAGVHARNELVEESPSG